MERRGANRCPVCQGPAVADQDKPDGIRCRNSTCTHNHLAVVCPRCKLADLEAVTFKGEHFSYTCRECTFKWTV